MKENQRITITKRMLKEGLLRLLEQKDLDKIRINELCAESGINRATFYRHYEAPRDVLLDLEIDFARQMVPDSKPPRNTEEARTRLEAACSYVYDHADIAKILFRNNTDTNLAAGLSEFYRQFWNLWKSELGLDGMDDDSAKMIVALLGGGSYCLLQQWIMEDIPKTPHEIANIMCNVIRWTSPNNFAHS